MESPNFETIDDANRRVVILANRKAGRGGRSGELVESFVENLTQMQFDVETHFEQRSFEDAVSDLRGLRCVVAAGGDGTAGFAANRIPKQTPLMLFPLGTENLMAKYLSISGDPLLAANIIQQGATVTLDAGRVADRLFLIMLSCGFDADVVQRLHESRSGNIHHFSYARPIFESITRYKYPKLKVSCWNEDKCEVITAHWVFIFNVPSYAAGIGLCPDAIPNDGFLDASTFRGGSFLHGIYHLAAVLMRRHKRMGEFRHVQATRISIESEGNVVPYQVDGDPGGQLPVEMSIVRERLRYVVAPEWAQSFLLSHASKRSFI